MKPPYTYTRRAKNILTGTMGLGIFFFLTRFITAALSRGAADCFDGEVVNGHYFLKAKGLVIEVSQSVFQHICKINTYEWLGTVVCYFLFVAAYILFRITGDIKRPKIHVSK